MAARGGSGPILAVGEPHAVDEATAAPRITSVAEESRESRSLEGVLKYAVAAGGREEPAATVHAEKMEPEKRDFLNQVLSDIASGPEKAAQELRRLVEIIKDRSAPPEDRADALDMLSEWVEDVNIANDLHKLGGFIPVVALLSDTDAELQWRAAELMGNLTENNPDCQALFLQCRVADRLLPLLTDAAQPSIVRVKALRALSCAVRGHRPAMSELREKPAALAAIVSCAGAASTNTRLATKAVFFTRALCDDEPKFATSFVDKEIVPAVAAALAATNDTTYWEQALACAYSMCQADDVALRQWSQSTSLLRALQTRTASAAAADRSEEEVLHTAFLLDRLQTAAAADEVVAR